MWPVMHPVSTAVFKRLFSKKIFRNMKKSNSNLGHTMLIRSSMGGGGRHGRRRRRRMRSGGCEFEPALDRRRPGDLGGEQGSIWAGMSSA
jgi:hypothetical protein